MLSTFVLKFQFWFDYFPNSNFMPADHQVPQSRFQKPGFHKVSNNMRNQKASDTAQDFAKKCHFTIQLYPCGHKTWLNKPRIRHVYPYCMLAHPEYTLSPAIKSEFKAKDQAGNKFSKTRCTNMASKPKEIHMTEICASCKPFVFDWGGDRKETAGSNEDSGVADLEKGLAGMRSSDQKDKEEIGQDAEDNSRIKPQEPRGEKGRVEEATEISQLEKHLEEDESTESTSSTSSGDVKDKEQHSKKSKDDVGASAPQAQTLLGSFANLFKAAPKTPDVRLLDHDEPIEIWTEVDENPDWDLMDAKMGERDGAKSDDDGVWIKVNRG